MPPEPEPVREVTPAMWDAARERGIEIGQPFGSDLWHWDNGSKRGAAATPGEALLQALDDKAVVL